MATGRISRRAPETSSDRSACCRDSRLGRSAEVLRSGVALRIDRDDLFDLLGQRPELMRQLFEGMFAVGSETVTVQS